MGLNFPSSIGVPSPREQLNQYVADLEKNPSGDDLREKIIKLALMLDPKPAAAHDGVVAAAMGKTICRRYRLEGRSQSCGGCTEVSELIRQAFLRGISTRQVGRVTAVITGEAVSAQTVSRLTRVLDQAVAAFHQPLAGRCGLICFSMGCG